MWGGLGLRCLGKGNEAVPPRAVTGTGRHLSQRHEVDPEVCPGVKEQAALKGAGFTEENREGGLVAEGS